MIKSNLLSAFANPMDLVITEDIALKYFGWRDVTSESSSQDGSIRSQHGNVIRVNFRGV
ncbi:MAG: hypothetical protein VB957_12590 [Pseudomonadales bacterium]